MLSRPLMLKRTLKVVEIHSETGDWSLTRNAVFSRDVFQSTKTATVSADFSEIKRRLVTLSPEAFELFTRATADTAKHINLVAIFNVYPSFRGFMSESVYNRVQMGNRELVKMHYHQYIEELKFRHEELRYKRDVTIEKSAQFVFQILRETGIIEGERVIPPLLPYDVAGLPDLDDPEIKRALLQ